MPEYDVTEKLKAEIASLKAELEKYKARDEDYEDERHAMLYMLQDVNEVTEKLREESDTTSHLLMVADATAHTLDIDKLFASVTRCTSIILACDLCLSYVWNREFRIFKPVQAYGLEAGIVPLFMTEELAGDAVFIRDAIEKKVPEVCTPDSNPNFLIENPFAWAGDAGSILTIPLIGTVEPLGLLICIYMLAPNSINSQSNIPVSERDMALIHGIMNQVSTALEQTRLYNESINREMDLSNKIQTIQVMGEIDRSILSAMAPEDIIQIATRMVTKIIPSERTTVILADETGSGFIIASGVGVSLPEYLPFEHTSATEVLKTGRPQYVADLSEHGNRGALLPLEESLFKEGFLSHLRVPLMKKGNIVGVLSVGSKRVAAFTSDHRMTLERLAAQIGVALQNAKQVSDMEDLFLGIVKSLSAAIDAKSPWTSGHSERVTKFSLDIGGEMGLANNELKDLQLASLLHDIGKIGTYEDILDKPAKLTKDEEEKLRQHPVKGAEILAHIKQMKHVIPAIRGHQEFYDGTGYPDGLKGEDIPFMARIITVADTVDAMGADRPYRKGKPMEAIIAELKRCSGNQFDPMVVEAFLRTLRNGNTENSENHTP